MILKTYILYLFLTICACYKNYDNYTLYRAIPVNEEQIKFLERLPELYDVQIWKHPGTILRSVDFTISPEDKKEFLTAANQSQMYLTTISANVQELFRKQTVKSYIRRHMASFDWHNYYRADDIYEWLKDLASTYSSVLKLINIGTTVQNRPIFAVRILHASNDMPYTRSTVVVEGGIHAREWISTALVTYLIYKVLHAPSDKDEAFKHIAFSYEWLFVPLLNPDGYEYTHTYDRLWRKNRNNHGVDINRNFDIAFGTVGISYEAKSEIYCGHKSFTEKESIAMRDLLEKYKGKIRHYIAFHAYGQYMIIPYAHLREHVENFEEIKKLGQKMASQIKKRYGTDYVVGSAFDTVGYLTSGVSGCWAKKAHKIPYVITFELRDEGWEGFALSPQYILPTCQETVDGLLLFLDTEKEDTTVPLSNPQRPSGNDSCCLKSIVLLLNFILFITLCIECSLMF